MALKRDMQHGILYFNFLFSEGKIHFVFEHHTFFCEGQPACRFYAPVPT